jgi:transcriptional regulator with XRE-family HTH domain
MRTGRKGDNGGRLGTPIRDARKGVGLTQHQLAQRVGVSRNAVSQWENGETEPARGHLTRLASALRIPIEQLLSTSAHLRETIVIRTTELFKTHLADDITADAIASSCNISRDELEATFASMEDLLLACFRKYEMDKIEALSNSRHIYGTLRTRLKYLLREMYIRDIAHANLVRAMHGMSWSWSGEDDRAYAGQMLGVHDLIVSCFDDAAQQGQIDAGNYRAASGLLMAAYLAGLRKTIYEESGPEWIISFLEPQLAIILGGFRFRVIEGLAEE